MPATDPLREFYQTDAPEELRLAEGSAQRLEFDTAARYLRRYLPGGGRVLDSCAGTGIYAFWLAERGFCVHAGDIVARNVELMRQKQRETPALEAVFEADCRELARYPDASFDGVLLMGALYHLHEASERRRAVAESLRLLRPGGVLALTYMNRHAVIINNLRGDLNDIDDVMTFLREGREGVFYASTPRETLALTGEFGLAPLCHVALDGLTALLGDTAGLVTAGGLRRYRRLHAAICEEESLLGYSYHCLWMGRKE